ncbi:MAG TPA: 16S rRNA (cytosine(1402)-N(4))-methyltransferase RsmH [Caulobacterales bacterium]|nr:16S rRNA (cytosine(1402)-N(4))-methyltransferase RsmH [Caulobacterales bacterium]
MSHAPVLLEEALAALALRDGGVYVDATFGGGGYARAMLERARCEVIGFDRDPDAVARGAELEAAHENRFKIIAARFGELDRYVSEADGVVFDIGVSSFQFDEADRGFSFQADAELDMRMERNGPSAADAVNQLSEPALADAIYGLGEDHDSRRIARAIVHARVGSPITRTVQLAEIVERAVGGRKGARIHPATKTFQALRMLVNDELGELARGLAAAETVLKAGGRLAVVSFHSLEDRLVKRFLTERAAAQGRGSRYAPDVPPERAPSFALEQRKAVTPGDQEIAANPRARSATLRWATRTEAEAWGAFAPPALAPKAEAEWSAIRA